MLIALSLFIGFITAFIGSIAGLGGGVILVPVLLFLGGQLESFQWVTPQTIVGISLVVMIFTGFSSAVSYLKHNRVDLKVGFLLMSGSIPGGLFGSWLNQFFQTDVFALLFGIVMIGVSLVFFLPRDSERTPFTGGIPREKKINGQTFFYRVPVVMSVAFAFLVGVLSGLLGIGGGSLIVPALILLFKIPPHIATATSMFMIFFASITSSSAHIFLGNVDWAQTLLFIPGAYIGGTVGATVNRNLNSQSVEWFLRVLLILIGIRLIWQGVG
ncbi:sulfite exporter TauE/SafE family protein [Halobacillus sp. A5]|uniref:sulfite exporter TauE/SafE family protein n=1 Tax=Halobacillus sp. A5 TaxID=2880263 RepID=UPI0020A653CE|nr:sulfite exporter TauE/SafE family protein [Halobacillus sp. A5]MCP3028254.1 sulfite exporter TauE/SafE family protein [Halobacillus sp. A5]